MTPYRDNDSGLHILEIELTNRCVLNCEHCYVDKSAAADFDAATALRIVKEADELQVNRLVFTGGDPMLYPQMTELALLAKRLGIPEVALLTSGVLITESGVAELRCFDIVQLSLDIPTAAIPLRKMDMEQLTKTIKLLQSAGIRPLLFATLYNDVFPHIEAMVEFAQQLGVHLGFNKLLPVRNNPLLQQRCLSQENYRQALQQVVKLKSQGYDLQWGDPLLFHFDAERKARFLSADPDSIVGGCTAGVASAYITVDGSVYPCPFVPVSCGNILTQALRSIWEDSLLLGKLRQRIHFSGRCGACAFRHCCGGCRGASLQVNGTLFGEDPYCAGLCDTGEPVSTQ